MRYRDERAADALALDELGQDHPQSALPRTWSVSASLHGSARLFGPDGPAPPRRAGGKLAGVAVAMGILRVDGLTSEEARARLVAEGPNELPSAKQRSVPRQVWDVAREPMLVLLITAGIVNFLLAEPLDGVVLMLTVVVVIGISTYQEHKTEGALAALRDLSSPRALVVRDGSQVRIAGRDVVREDVVLLAEGDRVPADAVLLESINMSVDESALTGESVPVRKRSVESGSALPGMGPPGGDGSPWVFSGTLVVKGHGIALVQATGSSTELGRIGVALQTIEPGRTPLQRDTTRLVRIIAVVGLGAAAAVVVVYGLTRGNWLEGVLAGIATAMAMLPEEFPVVLAVFLALGAWRMSRRHVLARRPAAIETLGSATVICVDKTGTLTTNSMTVSELVVDGAEHAVDGRSLPERFHEIAEYAVLASPVDPFDPMDRAFKELGEQYLADTEHVHRDWELVREYPLSEDLLALSHVWRSPDERDYVIAAKGAPEAIADLCHLDASEQAVLARQVEAATSGGQRVLAIARAKFGATDALPAGQHAFEFRCLGLAGLHDPVRPGVADAVAECARAGVRVVMITGDYPNTALAIAREIGLDHEGGCITGQQLQSVSDDELAERIREVSIFARMVPEQKLRLVRALKTNGEVVGMTGDGVNDAPALRAADIGIAMGAHGTDVARESAALVITDDDFASIAGGIRRGRGIFANLRKAMSYLVAIHVLIFGMALVPVLVPSWPLVLLPIQIALFEFIIDPACSIVFESEEIDPQIMDHPPRRTAEHVLGWQTIGIAVLQGLVMLVAALGVYLWAVLGDRPDEVVRSVTFAALVVGNLALILANRSWRLPVWRSLRERRNPTLKWILTAAGTLLAVLLTVPWLRDALHFGPVGLGDAIVAVAAGVLGVVWFEIYKLSRRRRVVKSSK
jgi:Ca2+-transporting ATPase